MTLTHAIRIELDRPAQRAVDRLSGNLPLDPIPFRRHLSGRVDGLDVRLRYRHPLVGGSLARITGRVELDGDRSVAVVVVKPGGAPYVGLVIAVVLILWLPVEMFRGGFDPALFILVPGALLINWPLLVYRLNLPDIEFALEQALTEPASAVRA